MKAFSYVKEIINFPFTIGKEIGFGNQGQVFEIEGQSDKIIKFSIIYDRLFNVKIETVFEEISSVYDFILKNPHPNVVKIFEFGKLSASSRSTVNGPQKYIVYFSIQEKLKNISGEEKKVFKTICDHYNDELQCSRSIDAILSELKEWYRFDLSKTLQFYNSIINYPIDNCDFRPQNILKDNAGNFKLIDFDLSEFRKMEK